MQSIEKKTGSFKSFDGAEIYYEIRGQGKPIVFCYGIACLFNHWTHQLQYFSQNYQTIVFDYRGHHKTPVPEDKSNLSIEAIGKDLIGLFEHLGIEKAPIISHSFGSQVLLSAYTERPDIFEKIIMINGIFRNPFALLASADKIIKGINQVKKIYNQFPEIVTTVWEYGVQSPLAVPISGWLGGFNVSKTAQKDIEIYTRGVAGMDIRVFLTLFEDMVRFDQTDLLKSVAAPTLIIAGSKDAVTPVEDQRRFESDIPDSELYIVPYGSHCVQLDFPDMVNSQIQMFVEAELNKIQQ